MIEQRSKFYGHKFMAFVFGRKQKNEIYDRDVQLAFMIAQYRRVYQVDPVNIYEGPICADNGTILVPDGCVYIELPEEGTLLAGDVVS